MGENQRKQQKYLTVVVSVEEPEDISENMISVESVFVKKQMQGNLQVWESQVGRIFFPKEYGIQKQEI